MSMWEDVERYEKAGLAAREHWWEHDFALRMLVSLTAQLSADPGSRLAIRFGLDKEGVVRVWHHVSSAKADAADGDDGGPLDQSFPCPPFCG